jgi:hypothetical protein
VQFGYGLNYLIDLEHAFIVEVEPTPACTYDEVESTKVMLDRAERCFSLKPKRLATDTAYGTGRFLGWLVGRHNMRLVGKERAEQESNGHLLTLQYDCGQIFSTRSDQ